MSLDEAFQKPIGGAPWEKQDNPQSYDRLILNYSSPAQFRHQLGLIGGNNVSIVKGSLIDLESDMRGITRINTHAPWRQYQAPVVGEPIIRDNWKNTVKIDTTPQHLPTYQMWAYPSVLTPQPFVKETCTQPHKF